MRIALAARGGLVRTALRMLIEQRRGYEVVAEAEAVEGLWTALDRGCDLALVAAGLAADLPRLVGDIKLRHPAVRVLVFSWRADPATAAAAFAAGADGWTLASEEAAELFDALACARRGQRYVAAPLAAGAAEDADVGAVERTR